MLCVVLFYLAAGNTILARVAGTCTQGDADRLFGVVVSIGLYAIALLGLMKTSHLRSWGKMLLPLTPVVIWQTWFSIRLSYEITLLEHSACTVLHGAIPPYPMSGSESFFAISWPTMSLGVLLGIAVLSIKSLLHDTTDQRRI